MLGDNSPGVAMGGPGASRPVDHNLPNPAGTIQAGLLGVPEGSLVGRAFCVLLAHLSQSGPTSA
jgi:hypothetical protein